MRIAAIGRSLGVHLVMATQRPQGAVSADIRANVTSCIALRVQSDMESLDVINSRVAAGIPITRPGRAYLVRGNGEPEEFQTATVTPPGQGTALGPHVMEVMEFLNRRTADRSTLPAEDPAAPFASAAARLTDEVRALWASSGGGPLRRPVAAPLPTQPAFPVDGRLDRIRLGLLDIPEEQRVTEFGWVPGTHGHLGLISGSTGGSDAALRLIVDQLLSGRDESHLYLLDAAGAFSAAVTSPRVGAVVGLHELRRAVRVLERVSEEMTRRLSAADTTHAPALVLALCGWGTWVSSIRASPLAWAEDIVQDLMRDGARAAITVLVAGERELVTARFFAAIPNRIFLPAGSTDEALLAWPRLPDIDAAAGRVVVLGPVSPAASTEGHVGQPFGTLPPALRDGAVTPGTRPFRVEPLPGLVSVADVRSRAPGRPPPPGPLWLGVGGDELLPAGIHLPRGAVLAVLGGHASGKELAASRPTRPQP